MVECKAAGNESRLAVEEIEQHKAAAAALWGQLKAALLRADHAESEMATAAAPHPSPAKQKTLAKLHAALDEALTDGQSSREELRRANAQVADLQAALAAAGQDSAGRSAASAMQHQQVSGHQRTHPTFACHDDALLSACESGKHPACDQATTLRHLCESLHHL